MGLRSKTKVRLQKVIGAFKLEDFFKYVLQEFNQVTYEEICRALKKNHLQVSKKQICGLFLNLFLSHNINSEDCERSIVLLQAQAVALKPESRGWMAVRLTGDPDMYGYTDSHVADLVSRSLRRNGIESITRAVHHLSAFWINITIKQISRSKGVLLKSPIFCVLYVDHPFIFISSTSSRQNIIQELVEAFGYVDYSQCKLTGRDPRSMLEILTTKQSRVEVVRSAKIDSEPLETSMGLDFSYYHKRQKYMDELFTSDAPILQDYSVECKEGVWFPDSSFPEMDDLADPLSAHLRTKDTVGMLKVLAREDIIETPLPSYLIRALSCARNKVKVRANREISVMDQSAF